MVKQEEMVLAFTTFQPESNLCFGGTGWAVEMAKLLKKILCMYDVKRNIGFDTDTIKIYSSPVIRCLKNNLLYTPF